MDDLRIYNQGNVPSWKQNIIRVKNAMIEEIMIDREMGYLTISYRNMGDTNMTHKGLITLIVHQNTIIQDEFGYTLPLRSLKEGMRINADFSSAMTKSIPPQSRAFRIVVISREMPFIIKVDRVLKVDAKNNLLYTGSANNVYSQMKFIVTNTTIILDRRGRRISLRSIRPGQLVKISHATFQTLSIPPQTTAYSIQVL